MYVICAFHNTEEGRLCSYVGYELRRKELWGQKYP